MQTIRIILWMIALALLIVILFPPIKSAEAEPIIQDKDIKLYAVEKVLDEFGGGQWVYFYQIIDKESRWQTWGHHYPNSNKSSAWGACGTLVKIHKVPEDFYSNPYRQIDWCINYIKARYKLPEKAWEFHKQHNWF